MKGRRMKTERVTRQLSAAIDTMKSACEAAERSVVQDGDHDATRRVLHAFAWGFANASTSIECAMASIEDAQEHE